MTDTSVSTADRTRPGRRVGFRGDVQGLRAFAVLAVIGVHLWPEFLPGGFAGVDVFFVISGFLITSHLLKELESTGRVRLVRFYTRRVKRLLPAAFLVLACAGLGVAVLMPWDRWAGNFVEIAAASSYVHNLWLALTSVDYHAQGQAASVVQHYWSLSVEEQFYLLWPWVLMAGAAWAARMRQGAKAKAIPARRRHLAAWVGAFALVFFAFSLWFTWWSPKQAYFFTPVRFWEFAVGGLVALASGWLAAHVRGLMAVFVAIAGWLALFVTTVLLTPAAPFPGWWALVPVLGTAAVVAAGCAGHVPVLHVVTDFPAFRFLGDISYSLYLWHWPLIILAPFALRHAPVWQDKLGILALTVALAWATKRWVEDPGQATSWPDAKVLLAMLVALGVSLTGSAAAIGHARSSQSAMDQAEQVFLTGTCAGPRALLDPQCREHVGDPLFKEYLSDSSKYYTRPDGCVTLSEESGDGLPQILECDHSAGNAGADLVYVVGDSHAQQWQHVVNRIATKHGWRLRLLYKGGCPMAPVPSASGDTQQDAACRRMQLAVEKHLQEARPERILHTTFAVRWKVDDGSGRPQVEQYEEGLHRWWEQWRSWGAHIDVIADSPLNGAVRPVECPVVHANDPAACAVERATALPSAPLNDAVALWASGGVHLLDMTDAFCDATVCHAAVGGVQVYYDYDHVQKQYTDQLADLFEERLLGSND